MRILGIAVVGGLVGLAALQSIVGGTPDSEATPELFTITAADICPVQAMTVPVIRREMREFAVMPAHKKLAVTPAKFGKRIDNLVIVPEHREGATFFTEPKRVIVSEPTRRLRVIETEFESAPVFTGSVKRARVEDGILITDSAALTSGPEMKIIFREAQIQAVRINAGLKMKEIKVIDMDGDGDLVAAETASIEVRTVETHPVVTTSQVDAVIENHEIEIVETTARKLDVEAVCSIAGQPILVSKVKTILEEKGVLAGETDGWSSVAIDAMAAAQAEDTGLVSPYLLLKTLQKWLPEIEIPTS